MARRKVTRGTKGRIALLHALAHIELNAIDLAWDIIARFSGDRLPRAFFDDWVAVADEEAKHHDLLVRRLRDFGAAYGDLSAHDGLWEASAATAHDLRARLAVVPMVLEARGLDVTPPMIDRLRAVEDDASADILEVIYRDEVGHVAIGTRWFKWLCRDDPRPSDEIYRDLVRRYFKGVLKEPFNIAARSRAGLAPAFYQPLANS